MSFDLPHIVTVIITLALVVVCVAIHYEGLRGLTRWAQSTAMGRRPNIAALVIMLFAMHIFEIWLFGAGILLVVDVFEFGALLPIVEVGDPRIAVTSFFDYTYYSAVAYTTLGMGEIVPVGPVRFMTGMEAVAGLLLITWSASFMFLEMQRYWGRK